MTTQPYAVDVMDGTCALCDFAARMVHRLDKKGAIKIAPIQGQSGTVLIPAQGLDPLNPDSWLFIEEYGTVTVTRNLDALILLGQRTGGIGCLLTWLRLIPKPARNWIYARAARHRYAMFGRAEMCDISNEGIKARLLP